MIKSYERLKKQNKERIRVPRTVQDTIPVDSVYKDGIFRSGNRYTKSYRFLDINYKIASGEDKNNLFLTYSDLLNSFDPSVMTKITINNRKVDIKKFKEDILIPEHPELMIATGAALSLKEMFAGSKKVAVADILKKLEQIQQQKEEAKKITAKKEEVKKAPVKKGLSVSDLKEAKTKEKTVFHRVASYFGFM